MLELFEDFGGSVDQALIVDTQTVELAGFLAEGFGVAGGDVRFGVLDIEVLGDLFDVAESEHVVFDGGAAVDTPLIVGVLVGEIEFEVVGWIESRGYRIGESDVGFHFVLRQDAGLFGATVAEGIETAAFFSCLAGGSG